MAVPSRPDRSETVGSESPKHRDVFGHPGPAKSPSSDQSEEIQTEAASRILFLDDDPRRAEIFLERNPEAVWVQTAEACVGRLVEPWEEVYLDHDLGGEHYVDVDRPDCGMEVVRWLCKAPREHLNATRFIIHSHNMAAALMMVLLMRETGYHAEFLPFGFCLEMDPFSPSDEETEPGDPGPPPAPRPWHARLGGWVSTVLARSRRAPR